MAHCKQELANYKIPRAVEFRDALPRNASGKVLKRELR
jgi:acyl-CoA synthetase (AMP-forming)/AMP-acid ligase II